MRAHSRGESSGAPLVLFRAAMRRLLLALLLAPAAAAPDPGNAGELPAAVPAPDPAYLPELLERARALRLWDDRGWLELGHYRPRWFGGWKSEADGPAFFRSPGGQTDPRAELEATLAGFFDAAPRRDELDAAQCRFPARFAFLSEKLGFDPARLPRRRCPRFEDFFGRVRPRSVTLVFSSWYLNSPGSSFGHTLLRLDKEEEARGGRHFELLDYGVNYAATPDTSNAVLYAVKGLLGMFKGELSHYAYYYKVREYSDYESRDLWEYDLGLTPAESALLAAHLWEVGGTWFDYWYLDENCASMMLAVLDAAAPRLRLLDHVGRFVVLPSDTVKALFAEPGLVREVHWRPSIRSQLDARVEKLSPPQLDAVEALGRDAAAPLPAALSPSQQAAALDAAADRLDLRFAKDLALGNAPDAAAARQRLLERRSALLVQGDALDIPTPVERSPERGHGSSRAALGGGWSRRDGGLVTLEGRSALHDFADPPAGEPDLAAVEFLPFRARWAPRDRRFELDDLAVVRVATMSPLSRFDLRPSWRFALGARTVRDAACDQCLAGYAEGGAGVALVRFAGAIDLLATGDLSLEGAPGLSGLDGHGFRVGVGPGGLLRLRAGERIALLASAGWRWLPAAAPHDTWSLGADLRLNAWRDLSLAVQARRTPQDGEVVLAVLAYF